MTPDLFAPAVMLDTSILRGVGVSSASFQVLRGLVKAGLVRVFVPHLAVEEYRTQWRERTKDHIADAQKSLKAISTEEPLPADVLAASSELALKLSKMDLEFLSDDFIKKYLQDNGFTVLPLSFHQSDLGWKNYFLGKLPSNKVKNRADIPDAHIFAALFELASTEKCVLFVCSDIGLRTQSKEINNVIAFESIDELVKSPDITPFVQKWQLDQKWQVFKSNLPTSDILERINEFVFENGGELLSWHEVSDRRIPEDSHTASISMHGELDSVDIAGPEDWGGGILRYRASFLSECLLSFMVFRGDAFDVPDWVSVDIGDFEKDYYFDAEGYALVHVNVDVTVRLNIESQSTDIDEIIEEISFEDGSAELTLLFDNAG